MDTLKQVGKEASKLEKKIEERLTVLWHEVEDWQQDNHFILGGYRPASGSYWKSWQSVGYLHNESVNIWTHLVGAIVSIVASAFFYKSLAARYHTANLEDIVVFACFFFGAAACLGISGSYHTICNHSHEVCRWGNHLDYMGIVILIWGSFIPSLYYGFHKDPELVKRYWTMITTVGTGTAIVALSPRFRSPQWRPFRAFMFVCMGTSSVAPLAHGLHRYGWQTLQERISLSWVAAQGLLYILGAIIYAARVPERWAPGRFDIWGSSHQIFHVLVLIAAAVHLAGLLRAFDNLHSKLGRVTKTELFGLSSSWSL